MNARAIVVKEALTHLPRSLFRPKMNVRKRRFGSYEQCLHVIPGYDKTINWRKTALFECCVIISGTVTHNNYRSKRYVEQ